MTFLLCASKGLSQVIVTCHIKYLVVYGGAMCANDVSLLRSSVQELTRPESCPRTGDAEVERSYRKDKYEH